LSALQHFSFLLSLIVSHLLAFGACVGRYRNTLSSMTDPGWQRITQL